MDLGRDDTPPLSAKSRSVQQRNHFKRKADTNLEELFLTQNDKSETPGKDRFSSLNEVHQGQEDLPDETSNNEGLFQLMFSNKPTRTSGFYRIHPTTARRMYESDRITNYKKFDEYHPSSDKTTRKESDDRKDFDLGIERYLLLLCFLFIILGYSVQFYFVLLQRIWSLSNKRDEKANKETIVIPWSLCVFYQ